jgi:hypothetical protein
MYKLFVCFGLTIFLHCAFQLEKERYLAYRERVFGDRTNVFEKRKSVAEQRPCKYSCNISNPTMRTGLDFRSAQFGQVRDEAEDWIKM